MLWRSLPMLLASISCVRAAPTATPPPPPAPPQVRIPAGCEADLSGRYLHAENPSFQYAGADDGGSLVLEVQRVLPDAGLPDGGARGQWIEVRRTPEGFVGATHAKGFAANGVECAVRFPTEVTACEDAGIVLRAAAKSAIDESCQQPPDDASRRGDLLEHRLRRVVAPPARSADERPAEL